MSSGPPPLCNVTWLIIINCYSSLTAQLQGTVADVAGLNQKHAEALRTSGLLSDADEAHIKESLEKIEDAVLEQKTRVIALQDFIQTKAEEFNRKQGGH